jgi:murein DD-endopeptidase MepM/ murein hydrolase activator NlpD
MIRLPARLIVPAAITVSVIALSAALTACDDLTGGSSSSSSSLSDDGSEMSVNIPTDSSSISETASDSLSASSETSVAQASSESSSSSDVAMTDFPHEPAMQLVSGSGSGYTDTSNWAPGICFPLAQTPDYASSQVYSPGGDHYPSASATNHGSQCDAANYSYPWHDNFCEARSWSNVMCKSGSGHQGQDIRPTTCKANTYWAVAAEDGVITQVASYTVAVTGDGSPHRIFRYLHMQSSSVKVKVGDHVKRGQKLGLVSNNLGISNGVQQYTTIHLHFEVRIAQAETLPDGTKLTANTFVPPYTALVDAYSRKLAGDCQTLE